MKRIEFFSQIIHEQGIERDESYLVYFIPYITKLVSF